MPQLNLDIENLPKCKNNALVANGAVRTCPIHKCEAKETEWLPDAGLDLELREFRCMVQAASPHAIYDRKIPKKGQNRMQNTDKKIGSYTCLFCTNTFPSRKVLKNHIITKHTV